MTWLVLAFVALGGIVIFLLVRYAKRAAVFKETVKRLEGERKLQRQGDEIDKDVAGLSESDLDRELHDGSE